MKDRKGNGGVMEVHNEEEILVKMKLFNKRQQTLYRGFPTGI